MVEDKLARIRKLLAQAEDPAATTAESEAFNAKAAELMARHGIDAALLSASDPGREVVGDLTVELLAPYAVEKGSLGAAVARGLRCSAVLRTTRRGSASDYSLHLFGATTDLVLSEMLLTSLMVQGTGELTRRGVPRGEHPAAYRRTWWLGFAAAIGQRLQEAEATAAQESETRFAAAGTSAALVLADRASRRSRRGRGLPEPAQGGASLPLRRRWCGWPRRGTAGRSRTHAGCHPTRSQTTRLTWPRDEGPTRWPEHDGPDTMTRT